MLVVPVPCSAHRVLRWQADTGDPGSMIGGYFIGPNRFGHSRATFPGRPRPLPSTWMHWGGPAPGAPLPPGTIRADLAYWRPAAVVAVTSRNSRLGHYLVGLLGPPAFGVGSVLAWRRAG